MFECSRKVSISKNSEDQISTSWGNGSNSGRGPDSHEKKLLTSSKKQMEKMHAKQEKKQIL